MEREILRQIIHFSIIFFIIAIKFIDKTILSVYFILASFLFLFYSQYIKSQQKKMNQLFDLMERKIRRVAIGLEREDVQRPFIGAFWFYFSPGVVFILFPEHIAAAAVLILAVSDSVSTLVGIKLGRHKILGNKTLEGSIAFFATSFLSLIFLPLSGAIVASIVSTISEIMPNLKIFNTLKRKGFIDDNWTIPVITSIVLYLLGF